MTPLIEALQARFRAIPGLRVEKDQDDTYRAIRGCRRSTRLDHLYPHSSSLLAIYVERPTHQQFINATRRYKMSIDVQEEFLGDLDGILYFSWEQINKLRMFHKQKRDLMTYNLNFTRKS